MSTILHNPDAELAGSSGVSVALIGPNDAHRKIVAKALSSSEARTVREFVDYPARLSDLPAMMGQNFDVVMIDVDSDESYALEIVKSLSTTSNALVMVYSRRNDPELLTSCMRAGARDFLPLPSEEEVGQDSTQEDGKTAGLSASNKQDTPSTLEETYTPIKESQPARPAAATSPGTPELRLVKGGTDERKDEDQSSLGFKNVSQPGAPATDFDEWDSVWIRGVQPASAKGPGADSKAANGPQPLAKRVNDWDAAHLSAAQPGNAKSPGTPSTVPSEVLAKSADNAAGEQSSAAKSDSIRSLKASSELAIQAEFLANSKENGDDTSPRTAQPESVKAPESRLFTSIAPEAPARLDSTPEPSARPTARTLRDGTEIPLFQYEVPEEERRERSHVTRWVVLGTGLGVLACSFLLWLFYMHPFRGGSPVAPHVQTAAQQQQQSETPANWHPVAPDDQPTATAAKPSPATSAANAGDYGAATASNRVSSAMMTAQLSAPSRISKDVRTPAQVEEPPAAFTPGAIDTGSAPGAIFGGQNSAKVVPGGYAISAGVAQGMLIRKTEPIYPQFARMNRISGTVILGATISKTGTIQGLHVISGPRLLTDAALDAVKNWRYRPYTLNNQPFEVQTTINVVFNLVQ
jgi:protein TonB